MGTQNAHNIRISTYIVSQEIIYYNKCNDWALKTAMASEEMFFLWWALYENYLSAIHQVIAIHTSVFFLKAINVCG